MVMRALLLLAMIATATGAASSFARFARNALLEQRAWLPVLYASSGNIANNIEHVVPVSVLRRTAPADAELDVHNWFVASQRINSIRSNYRFVDAAAICGANGTRALGDGMFVLHSRRLFAPREADWAPIVRAILHCHRAHGTDPDAVLVGGMAELRRLEWKYPPTWRELSHARLAAQLERHRH